MLTVHTDASSMKVMLRFWLCLMAEWVRLAVLAKVGISLLFWPFFRPDDLVGRGRFP